jgi:hypothetical protein
MRPEQLEQLGRHLESMPDAERPLYGLSASVFSFLSGFQDFPRWELFYARVPVYLVFTRDALTVAGGKRKMQGRHLHGDLIEVEPAGLPKGSSATLRFASGKKLKLSRIPPGALDPVVEYVQVGVGALAWDRLDEARRTHCAETWSALEIIPRGLI